MTDEQFAHIREVAKKIQTEEDADTYIRLVQELNRLLDEHVKPSPPKAQS